MDINPLTVVAVCVISHCLVLLQISMVEAETVEVAFQLNASTANLRALLLDGDAAFIDGNGVQLTDSNTGNFVDTGSVGKVSYRETIQLWNAATNEVANFNTHFQFQINFTKQSSESDVYFGGDGIAFFMAPLETGHYVKYRAVGGWLGLFDQNIDKTTFDQVVAVEFDTFRNTWDPNAHHVGIDVNNVVSVANITVDQKLNEGKIWDAWIDYYGQENILNVSVSCSADGQAPIYLLYKINLKKYLPENVVLGFSAAAFGSSEVHRLISWNFTSVISVPSDRRKISSELVIAIASVSCLIAACSMWLAIYCYRRRMKKSLEEQQSEIDMVLDNVPRKFSYRELSASTNNFSDNEKLGHGGFGDVYRGILVKSKEIVAVKRMISAGSKHGKRQYVTEIKTISGLGHRNLVPLLGWCHERGELLLIYEYMPNGSLDNLLFGKRRGALDWKRRYKIASDIASALHYLHEMWDECVVHRDVKSSNILLDSEFNAKLGDFGLARQMKHDQWSENSTIAGTLGYLAPECAVTGISSAESDVFSFGAVALEIVCGRRALDLSLEKSKARLVECVWNLYGQGRLFDAADSSLNGEFDKVEMETLVVIGLWCSHPDPFTRPKIKRVLQVLNFEAPMPNLPQTLPKAAYSTIGEHFVYDTASTTDYPQAPTISSEEMTLFPSSTMSSDIPTTSTQNSLSVNATIFLSTSSVI